MFVAIAVASDDYRFVSSRLGLHQVSVYQNDL